MGLKKTPEQPNQTKPTIQTNKNHQNKSMYPLNKQTNKKIVSMYT